MCNDEQDYYNTNGDYLKTVCTLFHSRSVSNAAYTCKTLRMKLATADGEEDAAALVYRASSGPSAKIVGRTFWISAKTNKQCTVLKNFADDNYVMNAASCYAFGCEHHAFC
jgi:hypothetical protein